MAEVDVEQPASGLVPPSAPLLPEPDPEPDAAPELEPELELDAAPELELDAAPELELELDAAPELELELDAAPELELELDEPLARESAAPSFAWPESDPEEVDPLPELDAVPPSDASGSVEPESLVLEQATTRTRDDNDAAHIPLRIIDLPSVDRAVPQPDAPPAGTSSSCTRQLASDCRARPLACDPRSALVGDLAS